MRYTLPAGQNAPLLDMVLRHQPLRHSRSQDRQHNLGAPSALAGRQYMQSQSSHVNARNSPRIRGACQHQHQHSCAVVLVCSDHSQL
jgi:hypothetical protein